MWNMRYLLDKIDNKNFRIKLKWLLVQKKSYKLFLEYRTKVKGKDNKQRKYLKVINEL